MTQTIDRPRTPTHSLDGTILASLATTFLAPFLAYTAAGAVTGYPVSGGIAGLYMVPFFLFVAPQLFIFIFSCSALLGWALSFFEIRHIAFYALVGAPVALFAWVLEPILTGSWRPPFLPKDANVSQITLMMIGMACAGAINGAIYWFVARKFSRSARARHEKPLLP